MTYGLFLIHPPFAAVPIAGDTFFCVPILDALEPALSPQQRHEAGVVGSVRDGDVRKSIAPPLQGRGWGWGSPAKLP